MSQHKQCYLSFIYRGTLRALPQSLTVKRQIKSKISRSVLNKSKSKNISRLARLKYKFHKWITKLWAYGRNTINGIELWYGSMKKIEGYFGSGVGTYFKFLRWLFGLDLFLMALTLGLVFSVFYFIWLKTHNSRF